jgi:hypothetical protein
VLVAACSPNESEQAIPESPDVPPVPAAVEHVTETAGAPPDDSSPADESAKTAEELSIAVALPREQATPSDGIPVDYVVRSTREFERVFVVANVAAGKVEVEPENARLFRAVKPAKSYAGSVVARPVNAGRAQVRVVAVVPAEAGPAEVEVSRSVYFAVSDTWVTASLIGFSEAELALAKHEFETGAITADEYEQWQERIRHGGATTTIRVEPMREGIKKGSP